MQLNPVRLKLPTKVMNTAVVEGPCLLIAQSLDQKVFHDVYKQEIGMPGLSEEKAFYIAMQSPQKLPSIHDLMLRNLRG